MTLRKLLACAFALAVCLVWAPTASATDFCVGVTPLCSTSPIPATGDGFAAALTLSNQPANPGADRIFLAPGTYNLDTGIPAFNVNSGESLQIIGAGSASTILTCAPSLASACLGINAPSYASSVSGITVDPVGTATNAYGISLQRASGHDLVVNDPGGMGALRAIAPYYGSVIDGCTISLKSASAIGLFANNSDLTARNCTIDGGGTSTYGVSAGGTGTTITIDHSTIKNAIDGVYVSVGTLNVSDTLIDMGSVSSATGLYVYYPNPAGSATVLNADRVSVVGSMANQLGAWLGAVGTNQEFHATIDDSVIYGPPGFTAVHTQHSLPTGASTVDLNRTAFNTGAVANVGTTPIVPTITGAIDLAATSPGFADPAGRDYRPAAGSPLIDAGADASSFAPGATDLAGLARAIDGNGDGLARADLGAFEYQPVASPPPAAVPTAKILAKPKKTFKVAKKGGFGAAKKGAASFSVKFTNTASAKLTLQSIGKKKRLKTVKGSQTLKVADGTIKLGFRGKWNKKKLKAGKYRVTITPLNASGARGAPVTVDIRLK